MLYHYDDSNIIKYRVMHGTHYHTPIHPTHAFTQQHAYPHTHILYPCMLQRWQYDRAHSI